MSRPFLFCLFGFIVVSHPVSALPDGWGGTVVAAARKPLATSREDEENLIGEAAISIYRRWELGGPFAFQLTAFAAADRETAQRDYNLTNSLGLGASVRYTTECCGIFSLVAQTLLEEEVQTNSRESGVKAGADHGIYKKVAGEWSAPRVFSGWSNIRFPGALAGEAGNWVAQGRYELSQGFEMRPFGAAPAIFGGLGGTVDHEGLSYNNKYVFDAGARLVWKVKQASISIDARGIRDRRYKSDELFTGMQYRLGLRWPF
ncbi:MAG: hypothetical protein AAGJ34_07555 [Pseudomonadota bacterium]